MYQNETPLVSIIIPVYNISQYLERCIESARTQTYVNLEIILVDDGSTDGSQDICDSAASIDSRTNVIHKTNGGLSSARNAGLAACQGTWISFVDGDDWIDEEFVSELVSAGMHGGAEIIAYSHMCRVQANGTAKNITLIDAGEYTGTTALGELLINGHLTVCNRIFQARLFSEGRHRFPENSPTWEDVYVTTATITEAQFVHVIEGAPYHYEYRSSSIVNRQPTETDLELRLSSARWPITVIVNEGLPLVEQGQAFFLRNLEAAIMQMITWRITKRKVWRKAMSELRHQWLKTIKNRNVSTHTRLVTGILAIPLIGRFAFELNTKLSQNKRTS